MKITHLLIALNVFIYVAMLKLGGPQEALGFKNHTLLVAGANYWPLVREGQVFRLLTSVFIHMQGLHLAMNMASIHFSGVRLEPHYGRARFVALYLGAGLVGAAASAGWNAFFRGAVISAGASGASMGLNGAAILVAHYARGPEARSFKNSMILWAGSTMLFGVAIHADNVAHAGGLLFGLAFGWLARNHVPRAKHDSIGFETLVLVGLVGGAFAMAAKSRDSAQSLADVVNSSIDLAKAGDVDGAIAGYRRALRMAPGDPIALYDLGLALGKKGEHQEAIASLRASIQAKPTRQAWSALAGELLAVQDLEGAKDAMHQASGASDDFEGDDEKK